VKWKLLQAILLLPGMALFFIPLLVLYAASGTRFAHRVSVPSEPTLWAGILIGAAGAALSAWTVVLFTRHGEGTPAPWSPPARFVVRGPYRHVRNPMILGAILMLVAESLILRSLPLALWTIIFFAGNLLYFPLSEEKGLERRFGESYRIYKANVPRWVPRLRPWVDTE